MSVQAMIPEATTGPVLVGAGFADAYCLIVEAPALDAAGAAQRVFSRTPRWISALLALRNRLVTLIGLKGTEEAAGGKNSSTGKMRRIGFFPIVSQTADRIVMGFDDWDV